MKTMVIPKFAGDPRKITPTTSNEPDHGDDNQLVFH